MRPRLRPCACVCDVYNARDHGARGCVATEQAREREERRKRTYVCTYVCLCTCGYVDARVCVHGRVWVHTVTLPRWMSGWKIRDVARIFENRRTREKCAAASRCSLTSRRTRGNNTFLPCDSCEEKFALLVNGTRASYVSIQIFGICFRSPLALLSFPRTPVLFQKRNAFESAIEQNKRHVLAKFVDHRNPSSFVKISLFILLFGHLTSNANTNLLLSFDFHALFYYSIKTLLR